MFSGAVFLAALNPFLLAGSAVDSVATTAVNLWNYNRLSPREREALVRYRTLIERDGRTDDAPEIVQRGAGARREARRGAVRGDGRPAARRALDADDLDAARFYLGSAPAPARTAPSEPPSRRRRLAEALAKRAAADEAALWPADDVDPSRGQPRGARTTRRWRARPCSASPTP